MSIFCACRLFAQVHSPEQPYNKWIIAAREQYTQGNYSLCRRAAHNYLNQQFAADQTDCKPSAAEAQYYICIANLKLDAPACTDSAEQLIQAATDPVYFQRTAHSLAQYYFQHNRFTEAIPYYEMAGVNNLDNDEVINQKFELAYCYFSTKQFNKAEPLLASIKELQNGKYFSAGNYYYGLLAYNENNYKDALLSFDRIKDLPQYKSIVPYYIAEIYYYTGDRKKALDYSVGLMARKDKLYYDNELHLLAAQCLFEDQRYNEALPYFEYYYEHTDRIRKEDLYEMAYCYYKGEQWNNAINKFKQLSDTRDSLGQTAMYLLGDCYLKTGDKKSSRNAFGICAEMPFNPGQQEAAMILYARLSYELGYHDDAVNQLNNLLYAYPESKYKDEAKTLLSDLLIKTGSYATAFDYLQQVKNKTERFDKVYQEVTYNYAIQLYQTGHITEADSFLSLSLEKDANNNYTAAANFWKGELAYKQQHYEDAITYSQRFLDANDKKAVRYISAVATPQHAYLNMGYAAMELNKFNEAQNYFNLAKQNTTGDKNVTQVATVREADAIFMQKDYTHAITLYDAIIVAGGPDADYAKFQKSKLLGLTGKDADKITLLQSIIATKPPSKYANSARYELALEYIEQTKFAAAIPVLLPLTENIDARAFASKAWMKLGYAYQQTGNIAKAMDAYKEVVTTYPSSEEYSAALDALKSLYIQTGKPGDYTAFLEHNKIQPADSNEIDSTYYAAAEGQFAGTHWQAARDAFDQYLRQYPNGIFAIKAHYYRAESNFQLHYYREALADYDIVLQYPWNDFSENSASRAAYISMVQNENKAALRYYQQLRNSAMSQDKLKEAYKGLVTTNYNAKNYTETIAYADTLQAFPGIDDISSGEAMLYKAKALQATGKQDDAASIYQQLDDAKFGAIAAEARYNAADILLQQGKLKEAETAANSNIKQSSGYDYWIVKSYILLADILTKQKDYFNAKATLQSIIKNTKIPELKEEASQKLEKLKKAEKQTKLVD